jgi:ankyrin repeat protein
MVRLLLALGAQPNAQHHKVRTPLDAAVESDGSIPDSVGVTPLELAPSKRGADLIALLD